MMMVALKSSEDHIKWSALATVRLETALAYSRVSVRRVAGCTLPAARYNGTHCDHCKLANYAFPHLELQWSKTELHSSAHYSRRTFLSYNWLVALVHSCCSHLEHRASVKRFVSLQFLNLRHSVGLLGRVISPSQGRYLTQTQNKHRHPCLEWDSNPRSLR
jgi:hypothetical protein